jgi:adenosylcobinamide-GDP ribazoletransferase
MQTGDFITDIARSLGFLSRLPIPARFFDRHDGTMTKAARAFACAGLVIALPGAVAFFLLCSFGASPIMAAFLSLAISTLVTGALHEDGLADTADGFGGGRDREHALSIMKDSRIGTYGAVSLVLSYGLKASAIAAIADRLPPLGVAASLIAAAAFSRALMVWHWRALPAARTGGVAASAGQPGDTQRTIALLTGVAVALATTLSFISLSPLLIALGVSALFTKAFNSLSLRKIGGHTGDTIGAAQQLSEIALLCALALAA